MVNSFHSAGEALMFEPSGQQDIVAVELTGDREMRMYIRSGSTIAEKFENFSPWLILTSHDARNVRFSADQHAMNRGAILDTMIFFDTWGSFRQAFGWVRENNLPHIVFPSPVEQFLIQSGHALFTGMQFEELVRAQLDIETAGLDPSDPLAAILLITASINGASPVVCRADELGEAGAIDAVTQWLNEHNPDVIEGHNIFNFDLPFLMARAKQTGTSLPWGRNGSVIRTGRERRFKAGARTIPYEPAYIYGRHIVDTYQQIQRYDVAGQLSSYGLKQSVEQLGLTRPDREFVPGDQIFDVWSNDPERLISYAVDDVLDTNLLSELSLPTEFYQTQILPRGLQSVATGGPGEKVNALLLRAYISRRESIPVPDRSSAYPGGFTALRATGVFKPIVKADAESLYPSIMLSDQIEPASDRIHVFLPILNTLTDRRLAAKAEESRTSGYEQSRWRGIQASLKVLINSFYGYLGYSRGYFSDFQAARKVTERGHQIIQQVETELIARGNTIVEIDTDGIYFQPAANVATFEDELDMVSTVSDQLGRGISLAHDGRWEAMLSLKLKNYALLGYDGRLTLKGSSLRSRRDEPFIRDFIHTGIYRILSVAEAGSVRDVYLSLGEMIQQGRLPVEEFARTETITDATFRSEAGRRLAAAVGSERIGERVQVYQRQDHTYALVSDYQQDEDREFLLRRLRDGAGRFRVLYEDPLQFEYDFPVLTLQTSFQQLRETVKVEQPRLF